MPTTCASVGVDAAWSLEHLIAPATVAELWTFFPDPWHKTKHHKRRLVDADFAAAGRLRLEPGGVWRLATDWADYAEQMRRGARRRAAARRRRGRALGRAPVTRFERKGLAKDRHITDLAYQPASTGDGVTTDQASSATEAAHRTGPGGSRPITMAALIAAAGFRSSTGALLSPLEEDFGWSRATTSGAVSLNLIVYGLTAPSRPR